MILVTGGAGVMGSRLVRGLVEAGNKVRVLTLPGDPLVSRLDGLGVDIRYGDVGNRATLEGLCDGVDTVYHLAAVLLSVDPSVFERVNVGGTRNLVELSAKAGVKHFILVSSISVTYPYTTPYSLSKRECERLVKEQSTMNWTIVRPTLAYNEYGGEEFMMYNDFLKRFPVVPFIGNGRALKNPVHVDDLMRGFLAIANNPKTFGKTYAFSGSEEISIWELGKEMLRHQGIDKPFLPIPVWICKILAVVMGATMKKPPLSWNAIAGLSQDANPDWSHAKSDFGYSPIGIREGLATRLPEPALESDPLGAPWRSLAIPTKPGEGPQAGQPAAPTVRRQREPVERASGAAGGCAPPPRARASVASSSRPRALRASAHRSYCIPPPASGHALQWPRGCQPRLPRGRTRTSHVVFDRVTQAGSRLEPVRARRHWKCVSARSRSPCCREARDRDVGARRLEATHACEANYRSPRSNGATTAG